jgi:hypothetical protein
MSIGFVVTKQQLDGEMGANALALRHDFRIALEKRHFFVITPDATLVALGYTAAEVATIKSAYADLEAAYNAMVAAGQWLNVDQLAGTIQT